MQAAQASFVRFFLFLLGFSLGRMSSFNLYSIHLLYLLFKDDDEIMMPPEETEPLWVPHPGAVTGALLCGFGVGYRSITKTAYTAFEKEKQLNRHTTKMSLTECRRFASRALAAGTALTGFVASATILGVGYGLQVTSVR